MFHKQVQSSTSSHLAEQGVHKRVQDRSLQGPTSLPAGLLGSCMVLEDKVDTAQSHAALLQNFRGSPAQVGKLFSTISEYEMPSSGVCPLVS